MKVDGVSVGQNSINKMAGGKMKLCSDDCKPICDFCLNFKPFDNYHDDGICKITGLLEDQSGGYDCEHFVCFRTNRVILFKKSCILFLWYIKKFIYKTLLRKV